jgi:DNA-binding beta-propeller fold protein YncE
MGAPLAAAAAAALTTLGLASSQPQVSARIATGKSPCEATAASGTVWVASDGAGTLARIDPRTNRVTARIGVGRGSCAVAAGAGAVWVANYRTGEVLRVDPATLKVRRTFVGGAPFDVLVAGGSVWTTGFESGMLVELDARTARITRRIAIGGNPNGLLAAGGAIWVGLGRTATEVVRVDPASGVFRRIDVGVTAPTHFVATKAGIWVANDGDAFVLLDPADGHVVKVTHFGRTLVQAAVAADGTVWVPDKEIDTIFRVDPATGDVLDSFPAGHGAFQALRAFGSMWVTSYAGADVWRFGTGR